MADNDDQLPQDMPDFHSNVAGRGESGNYRQGNLKLCSYELMNDSFKPLLHCMNIKQQQVFYYFFVIGVSKQCKVNL